MKIKTWIKYEVPYLPPRCRKYRYEEKEEHLDLNLREVDFDRLVLVYEDKSYDGKGKIYRYAGKLWAKAKVPSHIKGDKHYRKIKTALDWLVYCNANCSTYFAHRMGDEDGLRETVLKRAKYDMKKFILVEGELYEMTRKPEYRIVTFGLGNNHGGTGLMVDYTGRRDCGWHYPAEKGDEAMACAKKVALGRGDTESVRLFSKDIICY